MLRLMRNAAQGAGDTVGQTAQGATDTAGNVAGGATDQVSNATGGQGGSSGGQSAQNPLGLSS